MEKPITLVISETKNNIANIVNESKLPMFILDGIFRDLYTEIHTIAIQQEQMERSNYEKSLAEETKQD